MKRVLFCCVALGALAIAALAVVACSRTADAAGSTKPEDTTHPPKTVGTTVSATTKAEETTAPLTEPLPTAGSYETISQERAKSEMDTLTSEGKPFVLLDVRRKDEFDAGRIAGALLLPNEEIGPDRPDLLPDLSVPLYVYCRSGNRSLQAAKKLAAMGYTVYDFGGIIDWPYGTVS